MLSENYMLIALPNLDKSFTCTLFFPFEGEASFSKLDTEEKVKASNSRPRPRDGRDGLRAVRLSFAPKKQKNGTARRPSLPNYIYLTTPVSARRFFAQADSL